MVVKYDIWVDRWSCMWLGLPLPNVICIPTTYIEDEGMNFCSLNAWHKVFSTSNSCANLI